MSRTYRNLSPFCPGDDNVKTKNNPNARRIRTTNARKLQARFIDEMLDNSCDEWVRPRDRRAIEHSYNDHDVAAWSEVWDPDGKKVEEPELALV